jgi:hypothetical protein
MGKCYTKLRVLVGCEFSGVVRDAFNKVDGVEAYSCDLIDSERPSRRYHIKGDVRDVLDDGWDLGIFHPPCTYLCRSGARWHSKKEKEKEEALEFVKILMDAPIPRIALENPVGIISTRIRKPDQIIQPWMFGHGETKKTCLWLKNLPLLRPTDVVNGRYNRIQNHISPGPNRGKERSRTYTGIAKAMAEQWGSIP